MKRETLHIGEYQFVCDYYNAYDDLSEEKHYSPFVMLRNFKLFDDVAIDNDLFFMSTDVYGDLVKSTLADEKITCTAFPVTNSSIASYSPSFLRFNSNYYENSLCYKAPNGDVKDGQDIYRLYRYDSTDDSMVQDVELLCDKIRIYRPFTKKSMPMIVDINNYVNGIRVHYLCRPANCYAKQSETIFSVNNQSYSEFYEIWFPNMNELFSKDSASSYNVYFKEDLSVSATEVESNEKFITSISKVVGNDQYVPLAIMLQPSKVVEMYVDNDLVNVKVYVNSRLGMQSPQFTRPLNVVFFPYSGVSSDNSTYELDDDYEICEVSFMNNSQFTLASSLGFNDGMISLVSSFSYPYKNEFKALYESISSKPSSVVSLAYQYMECVSEADYTNAAVNRYIELNGRDGMTDDEIAELISTDKEVYAQIYDEEEQEASGLPFGFLGFEVEVASDLAFNKTIYSNKKSISVDNIDDFAFGLTGIFSKWEQMPEMLVARASFIDAVLGNRFTSNTVVITKEWYKYFVGTLEPNILESLSLLNENMKEIKLGSGNANFINNITCIIEQTSENHNAVSQISNASTKILYKPIFYKVQDLQTIKLRDGLTQNIGVSLAQYMTKVETFKLVIDGTEYVEFGRNDIYVIFKISASNMSTTSGSYNIFNQDDEYISTGAWTIY